MSFNWEEYINLAEFLLERGDEASLRSSISRAYYGVFCLARNKKNLSREKKANVHKLVINKYKSSKKISEKQIGQILDALRKYRNEADYDGEKTINSKLAERALLKAKLILEKLE